MRHLIAAAGLLLTAAAPAGAPHPANFNAFGIAVFQRLAAQNGSANVVISPVSIGIALSMTADGAAGSTRSEIVRALSVRGNLTAASAALISELGANRDAQIGLANAVWTRSDIAPSPAYARLLKDKYAAQAQALKFGDPSAAAAINAWTSAHTLGHVDRLVASTDPVDFLYLTNALSFEGKWSAPFKKSETRNAPFTPATGAAHDVAMMTANGSYAMMDGGTYRALRMPYGEGGYAAYILLPNDARGADALAAKLSASGFEKLAAAMHPAAVALSLPRFTAHGKAALNATLQAMGIRTAFLKTANFTPLHKAPPGLSLSKVDHASFVHVDEDGTVAAAATSAGISMTAIMAPANRFVVDHPFIFAIRDERSGNLLFVGLIRDVTPSPAG
ncbi:MAG: serpin family protein [Candidatus Baltobacteraceae bacterium]